MTQGGSLFREKALQSAAGRLSHDDALKVMQPRFWLAGLALAALCVGAVVFSFVFRVPVTVPGKGILLSAGGVIDVAAATSGQITEVAVAPGGTIGTGAIVARISQPELELQFQAARSELEDAVRSHGELVSFQTREAEALDRSLAQRLGSLENRVASLERRRATLSERLANFSQLMAKGNIAREQLLMAETDLTVVESQLADTLDERAQLEATRTAKRIDAEAQLLKSEMSRDEAGRNASALEAQLARLSVIASPFAGRVVEIKANVGQVVQNGSPILSLERDPDAAPMVVAYVPGFEAKRVTEGMAVEISPASAPREERGFIRGTVLRVADTPASSAGMMRRLQNDRLLDSFMQQMDTPFEVEIALATDAAGRVVWSGTAGEPPPVENGTLADVTFTLSEMPLAGIAIEALRGLRTDLSDSGS